MKIKGTKTEVNLATAFAGECMARTRYTFFASKAKKEGYEQISAIFMETAENEKEHAKMFLNYLQNDGSTVPISCNVPKFSIGSTLENLNFAAGGEHDEWSSKMQNLKTSHRLQLHIEKLLKSKKHMKSVTDF